MIDLEIQEDQLQKNWYLPGGGGGGAIFFYKLNFFLKKN